MNNRMGISLLFCSAVMIVIMSGINGKTRRKRRGSLFFLILAGAAVLFASVAVTWFRGRNLSDPVTMAAQCVCFLALFSIFYLYTSYLITIVEETESVPGAVKAGTPVLCIAGAVLWITVIIMSGRAGAPPGHIIYGILTTAGQIVGCFCIVNDVILLIRHRRMIGIGNVLVLLSLFAIPLGTMAIERYVFSEADAMLRVQSLLLPILWIYTRYHLQVENQLEEKETALLKSKVSLMAGRMRPHYLYNVLTTIYYLCDSDPQKAKAAIDLFSDYLRDTLEVMERQELVPLEWERRTIRNYLMLEKMRYGNKLQIESYTDVGDKNIMLPPLSIQPLIENAIRHGIARKKTGGKIFVETIEHPDGGVQISVRDDGPGFDTDSVPEGEGLTNVRERLRMQCGGTLTVESRVGEGTCATIRIPASGGSGAE